MMLIHKSQLPHLQSLKRKRKEPNKDLPCWDVPPSASILFLGSPLETTALSTYSCCLQILTPHSLLNLCDSVFYLEISLLY